MLRTLIEAASRDGSKKSIERLFFKKRTKQLKKKRRRRNRRSEKKNMCTNALRIVVGVTRKNVRNAFFLMFRQT